MVLTQNAQPVEKVQAMCHDYINYADKKQAQMPA